MKKPFIHLHTHSEFSLLKSSSRIADLIKETKNMGMPGLAITDLGNMYAAIDFFNQCKSAEIKPIIAIEMILANKSRHIKKTPDLDGTSSLLIYAKSYEGYETIMKLTSIAWTQGYHDGFARIDLEVLQKHNKDIIIVMTQKKGRVLQFLKEKKRNKALEYINELKNLVGAENLYLEVVNHGLEQDLIDNKDFRELSNETKIALVASNDTYYTYKEDSDSHEVLMCIADKITLADPNHPKFVNREFYFKTPEQMYELMQGYEDACENTLKIFNDCNCELKFGALYLPEFEIPDGYNEDSFLKQECLDQIPNRYPEAIILELLDCLIKSDQSLKEINFTDMSREQKLEFTSQKIDERLEYELSIIKQMGFPAYFLIVADFIMASKNMGIPVGPGRGSAAGSIVAYLTGITDLCPMKYGLYFERFLNPNRVSMPDVDIDFCFRRREESIEYCKKKYGIEKVCQIITYGKLKSKAVIKDVARVLEVPFDVANLISKAVPDDAKNLAQGLETSLELQKFRDQYENLFSVALRLEGLARHTGLHAAGLVISPKIVSDFVPVSGYDNGICSQYDGSVLESQGLLKMDFLGLSTLTVIADAVKHIKENRNIELDILKIPLDDNKVFEMLSATYTAGIFQVDSNLFKGILRKCSLVEFEDIIALVALGRPGPLGSGMVDTYIDNKKDPENIEYPLYELMQKTKKPSEVLVGVDIAMKNLLKETYGIILYQEQVMNSAVLMSGYTMAMADELRRAMGKKKKSEMDRHRDLFVQGALKNDIPEDTSNHIYDLIAKFAEYGFNKSHSACYGLITYQTAFLKVNYPQEFMAAAMTDKYQSQESISYLADDCERMKIPILSPDINNPSFAFMVDEKDIIFGMGAIKDVGEKAIEMIELANSDGPFISIRDFCCRVDLFAVNKKVVEHLIKVGAFDKLEGTRNQKLKLVASAIAEGQVYQKNQKIGQKSLFEAKGKIRNIRDKLDDDLSVSTVEQLEWEKELTGIYFSGHPLDEYRPFLQKTIKTSIHQISDMVDGSKVVLGGLLSDFKRRVSKKGEEWISFTLSDFGSTLDCKVFSRQFKKVTFRVDNDQVVLLSGTKKVDEFRQQVQFFVEDMELVDYIHESAKWSMDLCLHLNKDDIDDHFFESLKSIVTKHKGKKDLNIHYRVQGYDVFLDLKQDYKVSGNLSCMQELDALLSDEKVEIKLTPPVSKFR
ncbi:MAG: DNA polymerase III subunit alpha [Candidatus Cloacimonadota bacterium]|nr:MAG: DNA polymerase III subunit alpha [Candidatus Cloacimonadota bacterium]